MSRKIIPQSKTKNVVIISNIKMLDTESLITGSLYYTSWIDLSSLFIVVIIVFMSRVCG